MLDCLWTEISKNNRGLKTPRLFFCFLEQNKKDYYVNNRREIMENIEERFEILEELIRKVSKHLYPYTEEEDIAFLQKKDLRDRLYGKFPKCFLTLKGMGRDIPFLPICNRLGIQDPNMINFSMKMAQKMQSNSNFDQDELSMILVKLKKLSSTYSKEIPKPPIQAAKKGMTTRMFGNIKKYLDGVRGNKNA